MCYLNLNVGALYSGHQNKLQLGSLAWLKGKENRNVHFEKSSTDVKDVALGEVLLRGLPYSCLENVISSVFGKKNGLIRATNIKLIKVKLNHLFWCDIWFSVDE